MQIPHRRIRNIAGRVTTPGYFLSAEDAKRLDRILAVATEVFIDLGHPRISMAGLAHGMIWPISRIRTYFSDVPCIFARILLDHLTCLQKTILHAATASPAGRRAIYLRETRIIGGGLTGLHRLLVHQRDALPEDLRDDIEAARDQLLQLLDLPDRRHLDFIDSELVNESNIEPFLATAAITPWRLTAAPHTAAAQPRPAASHAADSPPGRAAPAPALATGNPREPPRTQAAPDRPQTAAPAAAPRPPADLPASAPASAQPAALPRPPSSAAIPFCRTGLARPRAEARGSEMAPARAPEIAAAPASGFAQAPAPGLHGGAARPPRPGANPPDRVQNTPPQATPNDTPNPAPNPAPTATPKAMPYAPPQGTPTGTPAAATRPAQHPARPHGPAG